MALPVAALAIRSAITRTAAVSVGGAKAARAKKTVINIEKVLRKKIKDNRVAFNRKKRSAARVKEQGTRTANEAGLEKASTFRMNLLDKVPNSGVDAFARLMNFLGLYLAGWIVDKLPKIINALKDLKQRIQKMASMFGTFVQKGIGVIAATGKLIVAKGEQLLTLDFSDQSGKVKKAQDDLDQAYDDLEADFESAKKILTAPLGDYPVGSLSDDDGGDGGPVGPTTPVTGTDAEKYKKFYEMAKKSGAKYPELVAAQFALESGYGSAISGANNYFGLKATASESGASMETTEFRGGVEGKETAKFMNFSSAQASVDTLVNRWYKDYGAYKGVNRAGTAAEAAEELQKQGYATDPTYAKKLQSIMRANKDIVGAGDGNQRRSGGQTPAYSQAVAVGRALEKDGYRAWQHPDFSVYTGYTGSGKERVMRRSYNSYHNYGEALDFPLSHNSEAKLDKLANYFRTNRSNLGVAELLWKNDPNHYDHLHVSFKGGGKTVASMPGSSLAPLPADDPDVQQSAFMMQLNAALAAASKEGSQPVAAPQRKTNPPTPSMPNNSLNSMLFTALSYT
jgi:hypothetical protein